MRSAVLAIAWSIWQRNRIPHLLALTAIPICAALYPALARLMPNPAEQNFLAELPLTGLPGVLSLVLVLVSFAHTERSSRSGFTGLPPRLFALPVSTSFLVTTFMALGALTIMAIYLAWAKLVFAPVGVVLPLRWPLVALPVILICFQAVVWSLPSFPWLRTALISAGAFGSGWLMALPAVPELHWHERQFTWTWVALSVIGIVHPATVWAVNGERCGGWRPWRSIRVPLRSLLDAWPRRRTGFRSASDAFAWLNWRRGAWMQTLGLMLSVPGALFFLPLLCVLDRDIGFPALAMLTAMVGPLSYLWVTGISANSFDRANTMPLSPFHGVKPISDGEMALVKLKVTAKAVALGWLLAIPGIVLVASWSHWTELWSLTNLIPQLRPIWPPSAPLALTMVALIVSSWQWSVKALSVAVLGKERQFYWQFCARLVLGIAVVSAGSWLYENPDQLRSIGPWLEAGLVVAAVTKLWRAVRSFAQVRRGGFLPPPAFARLVLVWLGLSLSATVIVVFFGRYALFFTFLPSALAFATLACPTSGFSNACTAARIEEVGAVSSA